MCSNFLILPQNTMLRRDSLFKKEIFRKLFISWVSALKFIEILGMLSFLESAAPKCTENLLKTLHQNVDQWKSFTLASKLTVGTCAADKRVVLPVQLNRDWSWKAFSYSWNYDSKTRAERVVEKDLIKKYFSVSSCLSAQFNLSRVAWKLKINQTWLFDFIRSDLKVVSLKESRCFDINLNCGNNERFCDFKSLLMLQCSLSVIRSLESKVL